MKDSDRLSILERENKCLKDRVKSLEECNALNNSNIQCNQVKDIINAIPQPVLYFNNNRQIEFVNVSLCKILGYKTTELIGQNTRILYRSENDYIIAGKSFYDVNNPYRFGLYSVYFKHKNGKEILSEILPKPVYDHNGEISNYIAIFVNVYDSPANMQISTFIPGLDVIYCKVNLPEMRFEKVNSLFKEILGYSEYNSLSLVDIIYESDKNDFIHHFNECISKGLTAFTLEFRGVTKAGNVKSLLCFFNPSYKDNICYLNASDVTHFKNMKSELLFKASLLDNIDDRITACDLDGNITYVNQSEAKTLGKIPAELIGKHINDFGEDISRGASQKQIFAETLQNGFWGGKVINFTDEGKAVVYNTRTRLITDDNGKPSGMIGISSDITKQEESSILLKESEVKFKSVFEQGAVGELLIDKSFNIKEANHTFLDSLDYNSEQVLDNSFLHFVSHSDIAIAESQINAVFKENENNSNQILRLRNSKGQLIWFKMYLRLIKGYHTNNPCALVALMDFSEIYESHLALEESENLFKTIFTQSAVGISRNSPEGKYIMGNRKFHEITGYSDNDLKTMHFKNITYKEDLKKERVLLDKMLNGEIDEYQIEKRIWHKNGSLLWINLYVNIVRDKNGKTKYWIATIADITKEKKAQKEFETISERLQLALKSAEIGVWELDLNSNLLFWDKRMFDLYETTPDNFDNDYDSWRKFVLTDDIDAVEKIVQDSIYHKKDYSNEFRIITGKGNEKAIKAYAKVFLDKYNKADRMIGVNIDVTENRKINRNLKAALKEKEILLRELYHRTKNNMQVISSMLEMESDCVNDQNIKRVFCEMVQRIHTMSLVHNKLYQSQNLSKIDLKEYLIDLTNLLISSNCKRDKNICLKTDMIKLNIILEIAIPIGLIINELITNSLKYAFNNQNDGIISVKTEIMDGFIVVTYSDNGSGLKKGFNIEKDANLGLTLIVNLIKRQLNGEMRYHTDSGFNLQFRFKDNIYQERV